MGATNRGGATGGGSGSGAGIRGQGSEANAPQTSRNAPSMRFVWGSAVGTLDRKEKSP